MLGPHWWQTYISFQNWLVQLNHQQLDYNMEVIPSTVFVAFFSNQRFGRGASCETTSCGKARPYVFGIGGWDTSGGSYTSGGS